MTSNDYTIAPERPQDAAIVEHLNAVAFGPGRFALTAYRVREQAHIVRDLCFTAWDGKNCIGSIRHALIGVGDATGLLLGPLVVHPDHKNKGCGRELIEHAMRRAVERGFPWVILVGDEPYYRRMNFSTVPVGRITFPGPVDPARILLRELRPGTIATLAGMVEPVSGSMQPLAAFAEPCGGEGAEKQQQTEQAGE